MFFHESHGQVRKCIHKAGGTPMLKLTRKEGDVVVLTYQDITIKVIVRSINGDTVKLGFIAPYDVDIVREELLSSNILE